MEEKKTPTLWVILSIAAFLILLCCLVLFAGGYAVSRYGQEVAATTFAGFTTITDEAPPSPVPTFSATPNPQVATDTLTVLEESVVPINNPAELACRLKNICDIAPTVPPPATPYPVGAQQTFWVTNIDTNENFQIEARMYYSTDHVYFWVQEGVRVNDADLKQLVDTFEERIYPTNRTFFGSEWSPGIDGDPHIYILYASGIGSQIAGYFSSADEMPPEVHPYSNAHEMFVFNADTVGLAEDFTYGVLAHEFQHMIHWNLDRNETSWLNEGFAELAAFLNGYDPGGFDWAYLRDPDLQLNDWPNDPGATSPHYGAGFLFTAYFLDRFGAEATQTLAAQSQNSLDSVDLTLEELDIRDPLTGALLRADDVFLEWTIANFLNDPAVADGRFAYSNYDLPSKARQGLYITSCPREPLAYNVRQYGADYIRIACEGNFTLIFQGDTSTGVLPVDPYSGDYAFWSNKGDESDMTLTRQFDLSEVENATLVFRTWYDIEEDYDYVYLEASTDGEHWQILTTPSGTDENPSGNSYGWGYNGKTNGWIEERVDLSAFAGQTVWLRFEYITDAAVNGEGMLIDDIAIPEIGYFSDLETDDGGWEGAGFVRIQNQLPQTFRLALITFGQEETSVALLTPDENNYLELPLQIGGDVESVVLVVTGTTRHTREPARYQIEIR